MLLNQFALIAIGLVLAAWTLAAGAVLVSARARLRGAEAGRRTTQRLARLVEDSPAIPLLVRADGRIEAPRRLAGWLGLDEVPQYLSELDGGQAGGERGLEPAELRALSEAVRRTQRTAAPFRTTVRPRGAARHLALRGHLADPQISPGGAALVWVFDLGDAKSEVDSLRGEAERAREDLLTLLSLIEAAPLPMWIRGPDAELRLVNTAYAAAVGATGPEAALAAAIELVEMVDGVSPADAARRAAAARRPIERRLTATIAGERRALRVTDLPIEGLGIAGYAVDVEEVEQLSRSFRAFREAQRSMLDNLSAGVAQFDPKRQLVFANLPFQRMFALDPAALAQAPPLERLLAMAREANRLPEVRDYAEWRREKLDWFAASGPKEESWALPGGTHLRVVAQPEPDGGLLLIAEDWTEQLRLSAARDTLLRARSASFDSLTEAVAVFAPDGRLSLWNRRFASSWGLDAELLDGHPRAEALIAAIGERLARPEDAAPLGEAVRAATLDRRESEGSLALADGRALEYRATPLPDENGLLTLVDVTDSRKAEQALRERNAALQEADRVKAGFLAEISQQFRRPLDVIAGFIERLRDGLGGELDEWGREYVTAALSSVDRINEHIDRLLVLSRAESGVVPAIREPIELLPLAERLSEERAISLHEAGLTLDLRGHKSAGQVTGDRERLASAIGNLLDNAIAATPRGGRILFDISRQPGPGGDCARIVISDNGPGMDEDTLALAMRGSRILADGTLASRDGHRGLPLARDLIEAEGGTLELLSEPGHGTAAIVELP